MGTTWSHGVVVGFDSSADSLHALRWALDAAERHSANLTVATAYAAPAAMPGAYVATGDFRETVLERADDAVRHTRVPRSVEVGVVAEPGSAMRMLLTCSRSADLVVVGRSDHTGVDRIMLGSVSTPTAAMAYGPVAVVPLGGRAGTPERVVACVDPDHDPGPVLDFAFDEARAAGRPVAVVHALALVSATAMLDGSLCGSPWLGPPTEPEVVELLERWSSKYGDVDHTVVVRRGDVRTVLLDGVTDRDLVVLGGRRHPRAVGRLLGSVPDVVLRRTPCAAVVVHSRNER